MVAMVATENVGGGGWTLAGSRGDRILLILDKVPAGSRWFSMERGLRTCAYFTPHISLSNNITDSRSALRTK